MTKDDFLEMAGDMFVPVHLAHNGSVLVIGDLNLTGVPISSLPEDLIVTGKIDLTGTRIFDPYRIPASLLAVDGILFASGKYFTKEQLEKTIQARYRDLLADAAAEEIVRSNIVRNLAHAGYMALNEFLKGQATEWMKKNGGFKNL